MGNQINHKFDEGRNITLTGLAVNAFLIVIKLLAGIWGQSSGLIADALHSVSDFFTDIVVLVGLKVGGRSPDDTHPFGHGRLETLASAIIGFALLAVAGGMAYDAGLNLYLHASKHPTALALAAAAVSIVAKEILYRYTIIVGRRIKSASVQANAWHHRSDALSSIAVFFGVLASLINPDWHYFDSIAALLVSALVLKVGVDILWNSLREFTDTAPGENVIQEIRSCALTIAGVKGIHDLKVRMAGGLYQMEIHIVVDGSLTVRQGHKIAKDVEQCLKEEVENTSLVTIHIDPDGE